MEQFRGTQKDWKEVGHNDKGIFIGGEDCLGAICHVYYQNNGVSVGEGRANARLIANAPLMNKALGVIKENIGAFESERIGISEMLEIINETLDYVLEDEA